MSPFVLVLLVSSSAHAIDPAAFDPQPPARLGAPLGADQWREFASGWRPVDPERTRVYSAAIRDAVENAKAAAAAGKPYAEVEALLVKGLRDARMKVGADVDSYGTRGQANGSWPVYDTDLKSGGGLVDDEIAAAAKRYVESAPNATTRDAGNYTRTSATRTITMGDGTTVEGTRVEIVIEKATGKVVSTVFHYPGEETSAKVHARVAELYAKAMNPKTTPAQAYVAATEAFYLLENTVPYNKGGSSMGELIFKTMVESRGVPTGGVKPGVGWDLLAWTRSLEEFRTQLPENFLGGAKPGTPPTTTAGTPGSPGTPAAPVEDLVRPPACKPGGVAPPAPNEGTGGWGARTGITKPGMPPVGTQIKGQLGGVGLAVVATGVGKVVEHETGSPWAGAGAGGTVAVGGAVALAKVGGAPVLKSVGGGLAAGVGGTVVREGVKYGGGSQTQGDVAGYATAGAIGAAFGGPIGAGGAVVAMAASDGVAAGIDWYYASEEGEELERRRRAVIVNRNFKAIQDRNLNASPLASRAYWENLVATPQGEEQMRRLLADAAGDKVRAIYKAQMGREPTPAEMQAAKNGLQRGMWLADVERNIGFTKAAYNSLLGRDPDSDGLVAQTNALNTGTSREQILRSIANSPEAGDRINDVYRRQLRRDPTAAEMQSARDALARGEGLRAVESKINFP